MKELLMALFVLSFSVNAAATTVSASTGSKPFVSHDFILARDVSVAEKLVRAYMQKEMGCSKVRLDGDVIKQPGFFSEGAYYLNLTADCADGVSQFQIDFDALCSRENEGEAALTLWYAKSGSSVSKKIIVPNSESCQD